MLYNYYISIFPLSQIIVYFSIFLNTLFLYIDIKNTQQPKKKNNIVIGSAIQNNFRTSINFVTFYKIYTSIT